VHAAANRLFAIVSAGTSAAITRTAAAATTVAIAATTRFVAIAVTTVDTGRAVAASGGHL